MKKYFGTDGIRGVANLELTPMLAYKVAKAGAYVFEKKYGHTPIVFIGKDTRISGDLIESAMVAGFLSYGAKVKLLGVLPTPAVAYLTKKENADVGVVISASHNSYEFNGIKFFSNKGMKISDELEEEIEEIMDSEKIDKLNVINEHVGTCENSNELSSEYINYIVDNLKNDIKQNMIADFCVAIDTANGATFEMARKIYDKLGINYKILNNNPNGTNINKDCGSTHLESLQEFVVKNKCNLGIAYDGDGDRCLAVDEFGNVVDGDIMLSIFSSYLKENGKLNKDTLVATVMSNLGVNKYAEKNCIGFVQTKVGDRYVLEEMLKNGYNLGGEQSGHIIFLDYNPTGDGIVTSLMLIQVLLEKRQTLSQLKQSIDIYPQVLINAKVSNSKKYEYKNDKAICDAIEKIEKEFLGNGRVLIRASGTEPLIRVMIEGEDINYITQKAKGVASLIEEKLN